MTSPISARSFRRNSRGFTLIELMVVIVIIALLIGLAVPMLMSSFRKAGKVKASADLMALKTALDAYRTDFGDYPRPAPGQINDGFALLGQALFGPGGVYTGGTPPVASAPAYLAGTIYQPGECVQIQNAGVNEEYLAFNPAVPPQSAPPNGTYWKRFPFSDGLTGPGFKVRSGGKSWGPYLQADRFKVRGVAVLDNNDNPILYFTSRPGRVNVTNGLQYIDDSVAPTGTTPPVWDAAQNLEFFIRSTDGGRVPALKRVASLMVDKYDFNNATNPGIGAIDMNVAGEKPRTTEPIVLWGAGADKVYGISDIANANLETVDNCDDVTTFR